MHELSIWAGSPPCAQEDDQLSWILSYPGSRTSMGIKNSVCEPPSLVEDETALAASRVLDSLSAIPLDLGLVGLGLRQYNFSWRELPYGKGWDASRIKGLSDRWVSIK